MAEIGTDIGKAAKILSSGGLVGIPTETVYGLAASAFDKEAIIKVFEAKNRPSFDPLITHIPNKEALLPLVTQIPENAKRLIDQIWPGPLTVVLQKSGKIADMISSGLSTAAFRMPRHGMLHNLLESLPFPLVAPSANPFGYVSPTSAQHVNQQLGDMTDYILDGGVCKIGVESTIVDFTEKKSKVLRLGGLSVEEIEGVIGKVEINTSSSSKPNAPGMLSSHYSPTVPVVRGSIETLLKDNKTRRIGVLSYTEKYDGYPNFVLSEKADLHEAAMNLFAGLRWFEGQEIDIIITEPVPDIGLGRAINDRLKRASFK